MAKGESYKEFVEKFEYKHTTDDCYTPENIYEVISKYVEKTYGKDRANFVRPFWPGGNYEEYKYPKECIVVDNPPFSIMAKIITFYTAKNIKFFLFASGLTIFNSKSESCCCICTASYITYENGARISTSFITNLEEAGIKTDPVLYEDLKKADAVNRVKLRKTNKKERNWPNNLLTAAGLGVICGRGGAFKATKGEIERVKKVDGVAVFGSGYLLNKEATARLLAVQDELLLKEMQGLCKIILDTVGPETALKMLEEQVKQGG